MKRLILVLLPGLVACQPSPLQKPPQQTFSRQVYLMGTLCSLTTRGHDRTKELARLERFVEILEEVESELSTWRDDTDLSRFNAAPVGESKQLRQPMCRLFEGLFEWNRETAGAFDPAVGPLIDAWDIRGHGRVPEPTELESALRRSGLRGIGFSADDCKAVRLTDTWIDSGGFGKGEALDRIRMSPEAKSGPWWVDLGGQVAASEVATGESGWGVELADPTQRNRPILQIRLRGGSLATSGGSERDLENRGTRIGHILDPRTGRPAPFDGSVTVWHPSGLVADILSTALYVLGPEKGMAWAESHQVAVLYLTRGGTPANENGEPNILHLASKAFRDQFPVEANRD